MTRIVMKVVTKAKKDCHSLTKPSNNGTPEDTPGDMNDGSRRFRTSNVMAKAKTPSLKASVLAVSFAPRLSPFSMGRVRGTHRVDLKVLTRPSRPHPPQGQKARR